MKLAAILAEIQQKSQAVSAIFDEADAKHNGEVSDDAKGKIVALNTEIADLEKRAADMKEMDDLRTGNAERLKELTTPAGAPRHPNGDTKGKPTAKSMADSLLDSDEWKSYFKSIAPAGQVGAKTRVQSPSIMLPYGFKGMGRKTLVTGTSSTSGGAFVQTDYTGIYEGLGRRPMTLRDIISVRTTQSDLVEYVRQVSRENAAAPVAEATATGGSSGVKPEGGMVFAQIQAGVKTIAEWVPATKRALSDAGQMQGLINEELMGDLEEETEDQILTGDGTGENFEGLDAVSGTQDQAYATSLLVTTRKARTLVRTNGRSVATAFVFNPADWETIDLLMDGENRFYFGGPSELGIPRLWGLSVVESEAQPSGNGWVGDFKKAVLWDREQSMISVSDSHSDFFVRNMVAILGELRAAFGVTRPAAFVEIDLTP